MQTFILPLLIAVVAIGFGIVAAGVVQPRWLGLRGRAPRLKATAVGLSVALIAAMTATAIKPGESESGSGKNGAGSAPNLTVVSQSMPGFREFKDRFSDDTAVVVSIPATEYGGIGGVLVKPTLNIQCEHSGKLLWLYIDLPGYLKEYPRLKVRFDDNQTEIVAWSYQNSHISLLEADDRAFIGRIQGSSRLQLGEVVDTKLYMSFSLDKFKPAIVRVLQDCD